MEENKEIIEALDFFIELENRTAKMRIWYWISILAGASLIAISFYSILYQAKEVAEASLQLTEQAKSDGVKALLSLVDRKIELLRIELRLSNNILGIIGGVIIASGIGGLASYKSNLKKQRLIVNVIKNVKGNS